MTGNCCSTGANVMILACSGASNVGQLANQAAVELTQEGIGKMFCLAGIGGQLSGFVQSAKDVPVMVAIDGCSVGCVKATLKQAQVPLGHYLVLTEEGIEKNGNLAPRRDDVERVKAAVQKVLEKSGPVVNEALIGGCGCGCTNC